VAVAGVTRLFTASSPVLPAAASAAAAAGADGRTGVMLACQTPVRCYAYDGFIGLFLLHMI